MKKFINIFTILLSVCLFAACSQDNLDPLTGKYEAPDVFNFTQVVSNSFEKLGVGKRRVLFELADNNNVAMSIELLCEKSVPTADSYAPIASSEEFTPVKYIAGNGSNGTCIKVNGTVYPITYGTLIINGTPDNYSIEGILKSNEKYFKISYNGPIPFEAENDEPSGYTFANSKAPVVVYDATFTPTVVPGVVQNVLSVSNPGGVKVAELYAITSDNASSLVGSYTIKENAQEAGSMGNGFYIAAYSFGGGSYVMVNGEKRYLTAGTVNISAIDNGLVTIKGEALNYINEAEATGTVSFEFSNMVDVTPVVLTNLISSGVNNNILTIKACSQGVEAVFNPNTYGYDYSGNGYVLSLDFAGIEDLAKFVAGDYTAADSESAVLGNFVKGYDTEMWGMQFYNWGSVWTKITDGNAQVVKIVGGKVTVALNMGSYVLNLVGEDPDGNTIAASYTGIL